MKTIKLVFLYHINILALFIKKILKGELKNPLLEYGAWFYKFEVQILSFLSPISVVSINLRV